MTVLQLRGPMGLRLCNGVTQCWPMEGGQVIVPGSSPYMVRESGFRPAQKSNKEQGR